MEDFEWTDELVTEFALQTKAVGTKEWVIPQLERFKKSKQRDWEILERYPYFEKPVDGEIGAIKSVKRLSDGVVFSVGDRITYEDVDAKHWEGKYGCEIKKFTINDNKLFINDHQERARFKTINDWVKLPPKKERVEVVFKQLYWDKIRNSVTDTGMNYHYDVWSNMKISEDKFPAIKSAIESCLNGEECRGYTQSELEQAERKAFEAARLWSSLNLGDKGGIKINHTYPTYESYKQSEQPENGIE